MVSGHFVKMSLIVQKKHKFPSLITFLVNVYLALPIVSTWVAQYQSHQMFVSCDLLQDSFSSDLMIKVPSQGRGRVRSKS